MLHISSIFSDELLDESSYIHGYRIYVTKPRDEIETNGSLRFKLLPLFAINDFISHLNKTLELGVEWLEKTSDL